MNNHDANWGRDLGDTDELTNDADKPATAAVDEADADTDAKPRSKPRRPVTTPAPPDKRPRASQTTIEKQKFIIAEKKKDPSASTNSLRAKVRQKFGSMISYEKAIEALNALKEGKDDRLFDGIAVTAPRMTRRHLSSSPHTPPITVRGRLAGSSAQEGFVVAIRNERGHTSYETFDNRDAANAFVAEMMNRDVPLSRIAVYARVETQVRVV